MSTVLAIILAIATSLCLSRFSVVMYDILDPLFAATHTGGPILFSLILAGTLGYYGYASLYVALRVFKKASPAVVFWVIIVLAIVGQLATVYQTVQREGGFVLSAWLSLAGLVGTFIGAGLGKENAQADVERAQENL